MTEGTGTETFRRVALDPGLYLVATPIGTARDITLRALDILASCDVLVAEDTRVLRRLMALHGVPRAGRPMLAYHDHNGPAQRPRLLGLLEEGKRLAYCSDAGTPMVADPGYRLAAEARAAGHRVTSAPGPSAVLAALSVSGLPSDRFLFGGFPPAQAGARAAWLETLLAVPATLVLFESGRRVAGVLAEIAGAGHASRQAAICRELTKRFEDVRRGSVADLAEDTAAPKGEIVLVLGPPLVDAPDAERVEHALVEALKTMPLKAAAADVAAKFGGRKRDVYQMGLALKKRSDGGERTQD